MINTSLNSDLLRLAKLRKVAYELIKTPPSIMDLVEVNAAVRSLEEEINIVLGRIKTASRELAEAQNEKTPRYKADADKFRPASGHDDAPGVPARGKLQ